MISTRSWATFIAAVCLTLFVVPVAMADTVVTTTLVGTPNPAFVGDTITFVAEITLTSPMGNTITVTGVTYTFDFGDGTSLGPRNDGGPFPTPGFAGESAQHVYPAAGTYDVRFSGTVSYTLDCPVKPCVDPMSPFSVEFTEYILPRPVPEPPGVLLGCAGLLGIGLGRAGFALLAHDS